MKPDKWEELERNCPLRDRTWDKALLYEYLVWSCYRDVEEQLHSFFEKHKCDERLAGLLFEFLLDEDYDGSESQIGAAYYIARLDKGLLRRKKELLLAAQQNEVFWKRPFQDDGYLEWL